MNEDKVINLAKQAGLGRETPDEYFVDIWSATTASLQRFAELVLNEEPSPVHKLYEELRSLIDGGSESMTHADAAEQIREWVKGDEQPAWGCTCDDCKKFYHKV